MPHGSLYELDKTNFTSLVRRPLVTVQRGRFGLSGGFIKLHLATL